MQSPPVETHERFAITGREGRRFMIAAPGAIAAWVIVEGTPWKSLAEPHPAVS